jgi:hypothetical protein
MRLEFGNVARAYFHAKAMREAYSDLSTEKFEEGKCGLLQKAMWGTRDAAQNWEMEYTEMTVDAGFRQGAHSACVLHNEQKNIRVVVNGDDFEIFGASKILDWFLAVVQQRMEVKLKSRLERGISRGQ